MKALIVIGLVLLFGACDIFTPQEKEFPWLVDGYTMTYDLELAQSSDSLDGTVFPHSKGALVIQVQSHSPGGRVFDVINTQFAADSVGDRFFFLRGGTSTLGIINYKTGSCSKPTGKCFISGDLPEWYVRLPSNPRKNDVIIQPDRSAFWIEWVNQTTTVPAGSFKTFSMLNKKHNRREIWSFEFGLVKLEILDNNEAVLGSFVLNTIATEY